MKLWFGKKKSSEDAPPAKAIPVTEPVKSADSALTPVPVPAPSPATPTNVPSPILVKPPVAPPTPPTLSSRRDKQQIPNERRDLYYNLMNSLYDAVLVLDENGHIVDCNERTESVMDYTKEDLWDMPIAKVIPAINPQVFNRMKSGLHGRCRVLINAHCHRKDGSTFPGEVGAGLMTLIGENLVLTIRNIEKRLPSLAIFRSAPSDTSPAPETPAPDAPVPADPKVFGQ